MEQRAECTRVLAWLPLFLEEAFSREVLVELVGEFHAEVVE